MSVWMSGWGSENSQVPPASHANPASQESISVAQAGRRTRFTVCRSIDPIFLSRTPPGPGLRLRRMSLLTHRDGYNDSSPNSAARALRLDFASAGRANRASSGNHRPDRSRAGGGAGHGPTPGRRGAAPRDARCSRSAWPRAGSWGRTGGPEGFRRAAGRPAQATEASRPRTRGAGQPALVAGPPSQPQQTRPQQGPPGAYQQLC